MTFVSREFISRLSTLTYNFHIFRLFGFGKEVDVYRFRSKQFIALFAGLLVLCSIQFISPPKMRGLI